MTDTPLPPFLERFAAYDPAFVEQVARIRHEACYRPSALDVKTKLLIALALDLFSASEEGTRLLARRAREAGASDAEIADVVRVCYSVAGLQRVSSGMRAFD
jgi:alkylhydroperoxidase/carboxymuconolactone decarboxylase family protein YurZ